MKQENIALINKLDNQEQYSRRGTQSHHQQCVPVENNENVAEIVVKIGKLAEIDIGPKDICHRLPKSAR